jgi:hypothetical protein
MFICALALVPLVVGKLAPSSPAGLALVLFLLHAGLVLSCSTRGSSVGVTSHVLLVFQVIWTLATWLLGAMIGASTCGIRARVRM